MAEGFGVGDDVALNSGSPKMTITRLNEDVAEVTWFGTNDVNHARLPLACLTLVSRRSSMAEHPHGKREVDGSIPSGGTMTDSERLDRIADILGLRKPFLSAHARHNLDGAIIDTDRQWFVDRDQVCLDTMRRVRDQLAKVEKVLDIGR